MGLARESGKKKIFLHSLFYARLYSKAIGGETTFVFNGSFICCANWMAASLKIFMRFLPFLRRALNWLAWIASEYYSAQNSLFPPLVSFSPSSPISSTRLTHNNISRFAKSQKNRKTIERVNNDEIFWFPRFQSSYQLRSRTAVVRCVLQIETWQKLSRLCIIIRQRMLWVQTDEAMWFCQYKNRWKKAESKSRANHFRFNFAIQWM